MQDWFFPFVFEFKAGSVDPLKHRISHEIESSWSINRWDGHQTSKRMILPEKMGNSAAKKNRSVYLPFKHDNQVRWGFHKTTVTIQSFVWVFSNSKQMYKKRPLFVYILWHPMSFCHQNPNGLDGVTGCSNRSLILADWLDLVLILHAEMNNHKFN